MLRRVMLGGLVGAFAAPVLAKSRRHEGEDAVLTNATLLIVRHAEKPEGDDPGLTSAGQARALAYVRLFAPVASGVVKTIWRDEPPRPIDALVATTDSRKSARPRLTLEPLSQALHLPIQQPCDVDDVNGLARWLARNEAGRTTLIAWRHGHIPKLLAALGADPAALIPGGVWPDQVYDWVIELRYDAHGRLVLARRVEEGL